MKEEGLKTCVTHLEPSHKTKKHMVSGAFYDRFAADLDTVNDNFGMNRQDVALCLSSKALKHIVVGKEWKKMARHLSKHCVHCAAQHSKFSTHLDLA